MNRFLKISIHVAASLLFMLIPYIVSDSFPDISGFLQNPLTAFEVFFQFKMLLVFYLHYYWLIPHFIYKKRYGVYFFLILSFITLASFISFSVVREQDVHVKHYQLNNKHTFNHNAQHHRHTHQHYNKSHADSMQLYANNTQNYNSGKRITPVKYIIIRRVYLYILVIVLAFLFRNLQKLKETKEAKLKLEIQSLKSNLNPHTLFNLLNGIYAKALVNKEDTAQHVLYLSQLLRYLLKQNETEFSTVESEIEFANAYVALQNSRYTDQYTFDFKLSITNTFSKIPTLITLPLIENAYTHLDFNAQAPLIKIEIISNASEFYLSVENTYDCNHQKIGNSIGLEQFKKRLQIYYPHQHEYTVTTENGIYKSVLKIPFI